MSLKLKRIYKILVFVLAVCVISGSFLYLFEKSFNEIEWKANTTQRYKMTDHLIESQLLMNKSKAEVVAMLGEPTSRSHVEKDVFVYNIGDPPSFFNSRKEHLLIIFEHQNVKEVTLAYE